MSSSPSPQRSQADSGLSLNSISITKKEDMKSIFRNQVDSLKILRQTTAELANLNKVSQAKQRAVKDNYDQQLQNFKKIRKDLEVLHKSIVKVMVCEERIQQIKSKQENDKKAKEISDKPDILELGYEEQKYNETKLSEYLSDVIVFGDQEQQKAQNERKNDSIKEQEKKGLDSHNEIQEKQQEKQIQEVNENKDVIQEEKELKQEDNQIIKEAEDSTNKMI